MPKHTSASALEPKWGSEAGEIEIFKCDRPIGVAKKGPKKGPQSIAIFVAVGSIATRMLSPAKTIHGTPSHIFDIVKAPCVRTRGKVLQLTAVRAPSPTF